MNKQHHILLAEHAAQQALTHCPTIGAIVARQRAALRHGAYAPDQVAFWADHIASANPYDPTDPPAGRAVAFLAGLVDCVATLALPFRFRLRDVAFLLGTIAHVACDLNQPYHVAARHQVDRDEHHTFERKLQAWALDHARPPVFPTVTLPAEHLENPIEAYFTLVRLPASYRLYRELAGHPERWEAAFPEIHTRAVHDILVCWGVVEREMRWRARVQAALAKQEEWESTDQEMEGGS